jgi:valyl-tRNA synthetase
MRLLHPFCPFITEEIWQSLPSKAIYLEKEIHFCAVAPFPIFDETLIDEEAENAMSLVFAVSSMIKNARQSSDLPANVPVPVKLFARDNVVLSLLAKTTSIIAHLAKAATIEIFLRGQAPVDELSLINSTSSVDAVIPLAGLIDLDKELQRLNSAIDKLTKRREGLESRLADHAFVTNAPPEVVATHKKDPKISSLSKNSSLLANNVFCMPARRDDIRLGHDLSEGSE